MSGDETRNLRYEIGIEFGRRAGHTKRDSERRILAFFQLSRTNVDLKPVAVDL